jgi:muramoyltetrapeptide carboxypeptidase
MIAPPFLKTGDAIGLVAPAKKITGDVLHAAQAVAYSWGVTLHVARHLLGNTHNYFSSCDAERAADFQEFLDNPEIKAILCARGAYGTTRIIDLLNFDRFTTNPKWIAGFSDITALHLKLYTLGIQSLHSAMPINFSDAAFAPSVASLHNALFGAQPSFAFQSPFNRPGTAQGVVMGGNLSLLLDALGTPTEPDTRGAILILEETDEFIYKIDRMFNQLRRASKLGTLRGLIVGHMTQIKETDPPFGEALHEIILHYAGPANFPVAFGFPSGHQAPNLTWPHGGAAILKASSYEAQLTFL